MAFFPAGVIEPPVNSTRPEKWCNPQTQKHPKKCLNRGFFILGQHDQPFLNLERPTKWICFHLDGLGLCAASFAMVSPRCNQGWGTMCPRMQSTIKKEGGSCLPLKQWLNSYSYITTIVYLQIGPFPFFEWGLNPRDFASPLKSK